MHTHKKKETVVIVVPGIGGHAQGETVRNLTKSLVISAEDIATLKIDPLQESDTKAHLKGFREEKKTKNISEKNAQKIQTFSIAQQELTFQKEEEPLESVYFKELHWDDLSSVKNSRFAILQSFMQLILGLRFLLSPIEDSAPNGKRLQQNINWNRWHYHILKGPIFGYNILLLGIIFTYVWGAKLKLGAAFNEQIMYREYGTHIGLWVPFLVASGSFLIAWFLRSNKTNIGSTFQKALVWAGGLGVGIELLFQLLIGTGAFGCVMEWGCSRSAYLDICNQRHSVADIHLSMYLVLSNVLWLFYVVSLFFMFLHGIYWRWRLEKNAIFERRGISTSIGITALSIAFWFLLVPSVFVVFSNLLLPAPIAERLVFAEIIQQPIMQGWYIDLKMLSDVLMHKINTPFLYDEPFVFSRALILDGTPMLGWMWVGFFMFAMLSFGYKHYINRFIVAQKTTFWWIFIGPVLFGGLLTFLVVQTLPAFFDENVSYLLYLVLTIIFVSAFLLVLGIKKNFNPMSNGVPRLVLGMPLHHFAAMVFPLLFLLALMLLFNWPVGFSMISDALGNTALSILALVVLPIVLSYFQALRVILDVALDIVNYFTPENEQEGVHNYPLREQLVYRLHTVLDYLYKEDVEQELVFVAHSQGTIIVTDFLETEGALHHERFSEIKLITMGCPYTDLYQYYFNYYPDLEEEDKERNSQQDGWDLFQRDSFIDKWVNIYRTDDYVGTKVLNPEKNGIAEPDFLVNIDIGIGGHTDYFTDRRAVRVIRDEIFRL